MKRFLMLFFVITFVKWGSANPQEEGKKIANLGNSKGASLKDDGLSKANIPSTSHPKEVGFNNHEGLQNAKGQASKNDDIYQTLQKGSHAIGPLEAVTFQNPNEAGKVTKRTVVKTFEESCFEGGKPLKVSFKKQLLIQLKLIPEEKITEAYCHNHGWQRTNAPFLHGCYLNQYNQSQVENLPQIQKRESILIHRAVHVLSEQWIGDDGFSYFPSDSNRFEVETTYRDGGLETRSIEAISDPDPRTGNIKKESELITRESWEKEYTHTIFPHPCFDCERLKTNRCRQLKAECIDALSLPNGQSLCLKWKKTFACDEVIEVSEDIDDQTYNPLSKPESDQNKNMYQALSKLEALKQMEQQQSVDGKTVSIFKGYSKKCGQIFGGNFYNCCKRGGWWQDLGFSSCNNDEKVLGKMRRDNRCVRAGTKVNKSVFGIVLSRYEAYCCFDTPLSRSIQEGARKQLGMGFGNFDAPDCRGLTPEELERVDFSKIDLSESFKDISTSTEKMAKDIELSLKQKQEILKQPGSKTIVKSEHDQFPLTQTLGAVTKKKEEQDITIRHNRDIRKENMKREEGH